MGEPNLQLLSFLSIEFSIKSFIETGSGHGETTQKALKIFPNVQTIELNKELYKEVSSKLKDRAICHNGKSIDVLMNILSEKDGPIVYWLDAHYSGASTAGVDEQCTLLKEIEIINERPNNDDFIIIDDANVFFSPAVYGRIDWLDVKQWPDIQQIFNLLSKKNRYTVILLSNRCVKHGVKGGIVTPENCIISVPIYAKSQLYDWLCSFELEG